MDFPIKNGDFPLQNVSSPEGFAPQVDPPYRVTFGDESFVDVDYDPMRLATGLPSARGKRGW